MAKSCECKGKYKDKNWILLSVGVEVKYKFNESTYIFKKPTRETVMIYCKKCKNKWIVNVTNKIKVLIKKKRLHDKDYFYDIKAGKTYFPERIN